MAWPVNPRPARSLTTLEAQVNAAATNRDKSSDGMIGDASHAARTSDHNAKNGVVHAYDITNDPHHGVVSRNIAHSIIASHDQRVSYVIADRQIASGSGQSHEAWLWRPYDGESDHTEHCHVSVKDEPALADSTATWNIGIMTADPAHPPAIGRPPLTYGSTGPDVKVVQAATMVDGYFGPLTEAAVKAFQKAHGLPQDGIVGPYTWAAILAESPLVPAPDPPEANPPATDPSWFTDIKATTFGGAAEVEMSGYDDHRIGETELAASLPARVASDRRDIEVAHDGKIIRARIEDVGPWYEDDAYWDAGQRPLAEGSIVTRGPNKGRKPNGAGIDLSPGLVRALGFTYSPNWSGKVDWRFVPKTAAPPPQIAVRSSPAMPVVQNPTANVEIKSAWASKINWAQVAGSALALFTAFAAGLPPEQAAVATAAVNVLQSVVTIVLKGYFTNTVTASSVK